VAIALLLVLCGPGAAQAAPQLVKLVDMIPASLSGEQEGQQEGTLAVDPTDPQLMAAGFTQFDAASSARTAGDQATAGSCQNSVPLLATTDGGLNWRVHCGSLSVINGIVDNKSLDLMLVSPGNRRVYAVDLQDRGLVAGVFDLGLVYGDNPFLVDESRRLLTVQSQHRQAPPQGAVGRANVLDQPTLAYGPGANATHVVSVGGADHDGAIHNRLFELQLPNNLRQTQLDADNESGIQGAPSAIHPSGRRYALTLTRAAQPQPDEVNVPSCPQQGLPRPIGWVHHLAVRLHRDDTGAGGAAHPAVTVAANIDRLKTNCPALGSHRLGSLPAVAVDRADRGANGDSVFVGYDAGSTVNAFSLRLAYSVDGGQTFHDLVQPIPAAINPAIAVNGRSEVAVLYQRFDSGPNQWLTEVRLFHRVDGQNGAAATYQPLAAVNQTRGGQLLLSSAAGPAQVVREQPYLGDYQQIVSIGNSFYGVFSANNDPTGTFPCRADQACTFRYQRQTGLNGAVQALGQVGNQLFDGRGQPLANGGYSIDPFFFQIDSP
jgi:hypothetical protein